MGAERRPEDVQAELRAGKPAPVYLFYGPGEFELERLLRAVREKFLSGAAGDFNLQVFYGDEADPSEVLEAARTLPFMGLSRLVVVRRTESFSPSSLERFIPYLEDPVPSTCLLFVSSKTDFKRKFYRKFKELGLAVPFKTLQGSQVVPWIRRTAKEMGLHMDGAACAYLQQIVGSRSIDLFSELEKLHLRYGETPVGVEEVRDSAIRSKTYTIFELMDQFSFKRCSEAISVLDRLLEEQDRDEVLGTLGMLTRQIRLLWRLKARLESGWERGGLAQKLGIADFLLPKLIQQVKNWTDEDLDHAFHELYAADGLLKSGADSRLVLENLVLSLCV